MLQNELNEDEIARCVELVSVEMEEGDDAPLYLDV